MSSLYRFPHILTFQVAAKYTTNKLKAKKNVILKDNKVNTNYNMIFFNNIKSTRYSTSLYAVISVHIVTAKAF